MLGIEKIAAQNGEKIAYISGTEKITYAELLKKAETAASLLKKQGTAPVVIYG